jgi:hypothetical protein
MRKTTIKDDMVENFRDLIRKDWARKEAIEEIRKTWEKSIKSLGFTENDLCDLFKNFG